MCIENKNTVQDQAVPQDIDSALKILGFGKYLKHAEVESKNIWSVWLSRGCLLVMVVCKIHS